MKLIQRNYHSIEAVCFITFLSALLTGCGMTGSTSFQAMSSSYREVSEGYANDNILINVIRASEQLPMTFLDMPTVVGSGTIASSVGVSTSIMSANPASPNYAEFQRILYRLIDSGLKTEVVTQREVLSGPIDLDFVSQNLDKVTPFYTIPNVRLVPGSIPPSPSVLIN